jgi:PPK2 family polyphosphate:nucleotide phosphotransferase
MSYAYQVDPKHEVELKKFDTKADGGLTREEAEAKTAKLLEELTELQDLLYGAHRQSVLIVLQGMDTSGKDGTIKAVTGPLNAQGCEVSPFKVPTEQELAHDFLWRVHAQTPAKGHIKVFNRSHYEDVLIVRVHKLVHEKKWRARYEQINNFERLLADSDTIILKFFLHISKGEQKERLIKREKESDKSWKLSVHDWEEREIWDDYIAAYEDAISLCNQHHAPWFIVPSDKKWFRNLAVAEVLRNALEPYKEAWLRELEEVGRREKKALEEYRKAHLRND